MLVLSSVASFFETGLVCKAEYGSSAAITVFALQLGFRTDPN